jgi:hypothetical protein
MIMICFTTLCSLAGAYLYHFKSLHFYTEAANYFGISVSKYKTMARRVPGNRKQDEGSGNMKCFTKKI